MIEHNNYSGAIVVNNLYKNFGKKKVLEGLSFTAPMNAITGFLGPNGAGKTTTMRILLGLIPFSKGEISILDCKIPEYRTKALEDTGAVVENPTFIETMTAEENLKWFGSLYKPVSDERISEVIELVGLKDAANRKFGVFSSGMKQRLGVAFGIIHKPKLLILDEPTSGMDPSGRFHMREILMKIHEVEKTSIFLSSHLMDEIQKMCDYVVIINEGKTVREGYVAELLTKTVERYEIRVKDDNCSDARSMLNEMKDLVTDISVSPRGLQFNIQSGKSNIVNEKLVKNGIEVSALIPLEASLEETFIQLTEDK